MYSDYVAVSVSIEWKVKKKIQQKNKYVNKKKNLDSSLYNEFGDWMCDRLHADLGSLSASMMEVVEELKVPLDKWTENRRGWVTEEVCRSVRRRRHANKE